MERVARSPGTGDDAPSSSSARRCGIDLPEALKSITDKAFMIVIQDFQDPYTLNVKQLMKCCVEEITPDGRLIPFCAYNSVGYREQVREQLSGVAVPTIVPNAEELQPVLLTTKYGSKTHGNGGGDGDGHERRRRRVGPRGGQRDQRRQEPAMSTAEALPSAEELKLCCASAYQRDAVALILGDSYHPGGLDLTRRLARSLELRPGDRVLDVASGPGTTAFLLASEFGVEVDGVDLGDLTVAKANATAASEGIGDRVGSTSATPNASRYPTRPSTPSCASAPSARSPTSRPRRPRWRGC